MLCEQDFAEEFVIDNEKFGERTVFKTLEEAQQAIWACGEDFRQTFLYVRGGKIYADSPDGTEIIGHTN